MPYNGFIEANHDRLDDFISSIVTCFANQQTRLALWLYEEFEFGQLLVTQLNGADSPFASGSQLAGYGYLITVESNTVDALVDVLLDCWMTHLEMEVDGNVALEAYDSFEHVFFRAPITVTFLESLKQQAIINNYGLYEG